MKNYFYLIAILVCFASCNPTTVSVHRAQGMVHKFRGNRGCYNDLTCTWFSKAEILKLDTILNRSNGQFDGVRVYLGLKNRKHTFLVVLTRDSGTYIANFCGVADTPTIHRDVINTTYRAYAGINDKDDKGATLNNVGCCKVDSNQYIALALKVKHDVRCDSASSWVRNGKNSNDLINTYSEWFDRKLVGDFADVLRDSTMNKDGVRIYLARRTDSPKGCNTALRHVFLLVITKANPDPSNIPGTHIDDYTVYTNTKKRLPRILGVYDNGEQCLNNCEGVTLQ